MVLGTACCRPPSNLAARRRRGQEDRAAPLSGDVLGRAGRMRPPVPSSPGSHAASVGEFFRHRCASPDRPF